MGDGGIFSTDPSADATPHRMLKLTMKKPISKKTMKLSMKMFIF